MAVSVDRGVSDGMPVGVIVAADAFSEQAARKNGQDNNQQVLYHLLFSILTPLQFERFRPTLGAGLCEAPL